MVDGTWQRHVGALNSFVAFYVLENDKIRACIKHQWLHLYWDIFVVTVHYAS